jgi:hypothetical protein
MSHRSHNSHSPRSENKKRGRGLDGLFFYGTDREFESALNDALCRADCDAGRSIGKAYALGAGGCIDNVDFAAGSDCVGRAFGFASTAVGAFFGDIQCHIDDVLRIVKRKNKRTIAFDSPNIRFFHA